MHCVATRAGKGLERCKAWSGRGDLRATEFLQGFLPLFGRSGFRALCAEAKVADFEHHVLLGARFASDHENILRLEVPVDHAVRVQVLNTVEHLVNEANRVLFAE